MPEYLLRHRSTSRFAFDLQRLKLLEAMDMRFTVAIIGRMDVGKSTLLNALIGKDLAPTGVKETTATINWFRYGQGRQCGTFKVHWLDGSTEDIPLERTGEWIGTEVNARDTRCLDFFADTPFLEKANVVDTPGTCSVIQTHEDATKGFLADKLTADTLRHGGSADAVIYAINPVGKEQDRDMLQLFGEKTRLPGASAYNSIAVVQKWEHLQPDPLEEVQKSCDMLRAQLEGKVAAVIPTSGLLARCVDEVPVDQWQLVATLATSTEAASLDALLLGEQYFCEDCPAAAVDQQNRRAILSSISWNILPLCISIARKQKIDDGARLQAALREASGIPALLDLLQQHFFSRARLIKASTILRKAWEPCAIASQTLRQQLAAQGNMVTRGREAQAAIASHVQATPNLKAAERYVEDSLAILDRDVEVMKEIECEVDSLQYQVTRYFDVFNEDIQCLKLLEEHAGVLSPEQVSELARLFGQAKFDLWSRLGHVAQPEALNDVLGDVRERFSFWALQRQRSHGALKHIYSHACDVLDLILNNLET